MSVMFFETSLPGVFLVEPVVFKDDRGFFMETYHQEKYVGGGIGRTFVQDNYSHSTRKGILRGLHYQLRHAQAKLIYVVEGEIFDVAVDIRRGSPCFGQWFGTHLSSKNKRQMFIPEGFAHGFCVLSEMADIMYKCTDFYVPQDEFGVDWSDPTVGIDWPLESPHLSEKDAQNPLLSEIPEDSLPVYKKGKALIQGSTPAYAENIIVHVAPELENVLPGFLQNRHRDVKTLKEAIAKDDYGYISELAQGIKKDAERYGFDTLTVSGQALEDAAKEKDGATIEKEISKLQGYLRRIQVVYDDNAR